MADEHDIKNIKKAKYIAAANRQPRKWARIADWKWHYNFIRWGYHRVKALGSIRRQNGAYRRPWKILLENTPAHSMVIWKQILSIHVYKKKAITWCEIAQAFQMRLRSMTIIEAIISISPLIDEAAEIIISQWRSILIVVFRGKYIMSRPVISII